MENGDDALLGGGQEMIDTQQVRQGTRQGRVQNRTGWVAMSARVSTRPPKPTLPQLPWWLPAVHSIKKAANCHSSSWPAAGTELVSTV